MSHPSWTLLRKGLENEGRRETTDTIRTQWQKKRTKLRNYGNRKTGKAEAEQLCEKSESQWSETTGDNNNEVTALPVEDSLQTQKDPRIYPRRGKTHIGTDKKNRGFIPG